MLTIIEVMCIISKMNLTWHQSGIRAPLIHNEKAATHSSHTFWDDDMNAGHKRHGLQSYVPLNSVSRSLTPPSTALVDVSRQHDRVLSKCYVSWLCRRVHLVLTVAFSLHATLRLLMKWRCSEQKYHRTTWVFISALQEDKCLRGSHIPSLGERRAEPSGAGTLEGPPWPRLMPALHCLTD